jgi:hypothetical protein
MRIQDTIISNLDLQELVRKPDVYNIEKEIESLHRLLDKLAPDTIDVGDLIGDRILKLLSSDADWDKIK